MAARQVGAEPTSPCAQVEHLASLLRNRTNVSQHIWRLEAKIVDNIEKQVVRRLLWDGEVPGTSSGTRAAVAHGQCLPRDSWKRAKSTAPSSAKQSGTRMDLDAWSSWGEQRWSGRCTGAVFTCWDCGCQLGHYQRNWGTRWCLEKIWAVMGLEPGISGLVGKLGCVKSRGPVWSGRFEQGDFV